MQITSPAIVAPFRDEFLDGYLDDIPRKLPNKVLVFQLSETNPPSLRIPLDISQERGTHPECRGRLIFHLD